ncbi:MAG: hypothetical protein DMF84_03720 [Acidobacteria bacterium]|nr:MAG: hypothetical protein DMF84_03720 [Acidobacteriota bacterium]
MKNTILALALAAAVAAAGCIGFEHTSTATSPSGGGVNALMGTWASASVVPSPSSCADFKWNATERTSTSAKGSFSATCPNDLKVTGTAEGTLSGTTVAWSANGNATGPNQESCPFTLTGTAELGVDSIRVPYSGTACSIPVSGVEILKRK